MIGGLWPRRWCPTEVVGKGSAREREYTSDDWHWASRIRRPIFGLTMDLIFTAFLALVVQEEKPTHYSFTIDGMEYKPSMKARAGSTQKTHYGCRGGAPAPVGTARRP